MGDIGTPLQFRDSDDSYSSGNPEIIIWDGNFVYVTLGNAGFSIYSVSQEGRLTLKSNTNYGGNCKYFFTFDITGNGGNRDKNRQQS